MSRSTALRLVGALAVLAVGAVHLYEYLAGSPAPGAPIHYSDIPTIGWLFLLNAIGGGVIGLGLLALGDRLVSSLLAVGGIGLAGGALAALLVSENTPLFGFQETRGYPAIIVLTIVVEAIALVTLPAYLATRRAQLLSAVRSARSRPPSQARPQT